MSGELKTRTEMQSLIAMWRPHISKKMHGGAQVLYRFRNGYSASIVCHRQSYGYEEGLLELAIIKDGSLCYDTPITSDVIGHLTALEALEIIEKIEKL